jgi:hypothetical protein
MKRTLFLLIFALVLNYWGWGQPWTYDFGTGTGSYTTASSASTSFLPTPPSGSSYVRIGTTGGSVNLDNSTTGALKIGSDTRLRLVAPTSASVVKASVYNYTAGKSFYTKFSLLLGDQNGGNVSSGTFSFWQGDGANFSDASAFNNAQMFTGIRFGISSGTLVTSCRVATVWTNPLSIVLSQGNVYTFEIFGNNTTASINYTYNGLSQTVAPNTEDIRINGVLVGDDLGKAGLANNANVDSWMFYGETSTGNVANIFIDDVVYSNSIAASYEPIVNYYSKSTGNLNISSNWTTNNDGSGSNTPSDFISGYSVFNVRNNATPTVGADWTVSGTLSKIVVGDGTNACAFTAANNISTPNLQINANASFTLNAAKQLTVTNTLTNNAGISGLIIKSDATGTGTLLCSTAGVQGKMQRYLSCSKWHLISSPVSNAVSGMFMGNYLKYYNEATGGYVGINLSTIPLTPGKGYLYWNTGTGYATKEYSGLLNAGDVSFSYTKTTDGWNLSGNPYPSVLDWDVVSPTLPATVNGGVSMYDPITNTYKYYIMGGGAANTATQYVSPGQGFFVQATGSGTMTFTDAMRTHNGTPPFYKSASADQMLLLKISGNNITTQTAVRFGADATTGIDRLLDMCKIMEPTPQVPMLYTVCEGQKMVLNTLPLLYIKEGTIIPVYFEAGVGGSYQIEASEMGSIDPTTSIYLEDVSRSYTQDLRLKPTYNFDYFTQGQVLKMLIHFKNRKTGVDETGTIADGVQCYTSDNQLYVNFTPEVFETKEGEANIEVYTLTGQQVCSRQTGSPTNQIELSAVAGAIYIVKVTYGNQVYVKKIIL